MTITQIIDDIDNLIGSGAPPAKLRAQLGTLREQAEAIESHLKDLEAQVQNPEIERKCEALQADVNQLQSENESLKTTIANWQSQQHQQSEREGQARLHGYGTGALG